MAIAVVNHRTVGDHLVRLNAFRNSTNSFTATKGHTNHFGRLPSEWVDRYRADNDEFGIQYTVFSDATPIAWVTEDGRAVIPDESYSTSTGKHQSQCRAWLPGQK